MDGRVPDVVAEPPMAAMARRIGAGPSQAAFLVMLDHLHQVIQTVRPSPDDLRRTLDFLTELGQHSDTRRQEWVLLADILGVSTLVEDLATDRPAGATPNTLAGPFYREDAPDLPDSANLSRDGKGQVLAVAGRVTGLDGRGVTGARVEVWQANAEGRYENQEPDLQPEFNLRGRFRTDAEGRFAFRSVKPGGYRLPDDGPVGRLARHLGLTLERPAHLHFRVTAPGFQPLTTHVFDRDDPAIGRDALFGVKPDLLGCFRREGTAEAPLWTLDVAFVLAPAGAVTG